MLDTLIKSTMYRDIALSYPHIAIRMKQLWGKDAFEDYMHELLTDTRNGERRGFPEEDRKRLIDIQQLYKFHFGKLEHQEDPWHFRS